MKKILFTILLFFAALDPASACVCDELNKETTEELFEKSDYIIIGTAIINSEFESQFEKFLNTKNKGTNVLLQVESVLKGDVKLKEKLFVYQFQTSCTRIFQIGEKYLIFGEKIEKFTQAEIDRTHSGELSPPPPPPSVNDGLVKLYTHEKEEVKLLNDQILRYKTITTDQCTSLSVESKGFSTTISYLKTQNN
ncbi:hypothetical protein SAMN04488034_1192 [Salinimicrobium catena]|uniref:Uncharacterized protein n=1 Tax=Salinimicrobium catena TaxID=390640 RepID=A0A1H5PJB9_9FLAO|nr:hypothetical protein [Salinimicrobium catena]SDL86483.1 hypothetical protein SAMN04488140_1202 [Salinimicrobium catena]SEF13308.1 hypothetical protein SAMN04488034_1192 [Salinimicrobium catena]